MVTNDDDLVVEIRTFKPIDVSTVRDTGMQALITLAASLGWNVHQKHNQPVVITARDGTQKRLPTNTSIRMGVFQSALSTIMAHSLEMVPTIDLIDGIIATIKVSTDHARRLRLAVGETTAQHRERVASLEAAAERKREPDEHLTQHIEVPDVPLEAWTEAAAPAAVDQEDALPPADGGDHGAIVSSKPFMAVRQTKGGIADTYESDTSFERIFEKDGYKDYACQVCGAVYSTPKGVGSHSQIHSRTREVKQPAWARAASQGKVERSPVQAHRTPPVALEWVDPPMTETINTVEYEGAFPAEIAVPRIDTDPLFVLGQITALVAPELVAELDQLRAEVATLRVERDSLKENLQALKDLIGGL